MLFEIHFVETVDRNRDFRYFEPKSKFFQKCRPKSRFLKFWAESNFCSKMLIEVEIFEILNRNPFFFSNMLTEIEIFEILNRNRNIFKKCWPKWRFPKFWTEIGISLENIDRNQDFRNFLPKLNFFPKWSLKSRFSKFWTEIYLFSKRWPESKFWTEIEIFSKMLTENEIF